ncbi:DNA repair protein RadC [Thermodesulfobacterium sp. TA1]|uniref:RadC family protein n=1 Tax=Thermodesulfobacterium sp. TA1 TaxID=2234087 RepID=UPI001232B5E5|nr:DNA repair protein RadC [Thermodesulfobacterium sp. TA1]QER41987.1 DNA repair protein RadC [Thermodesulfobacterium sp. TA1]
MTEEKTYRQKILVEAYEKAKGHRARVKERFLKEGPERFTDEDLLELLLMFSLPYRDTRKLARTLLNHYKTLDQVLDAPLEELKTFKGLKEKAVLPLKVINEVARRYLKTKALKTEYLRSPQEVYEYLRYELQNLDREVLKVLFLDAKSKVLGVETLFEGTLHESAVYPREIFKKTLEKKALSIVLVHNHPSGDPTPSREDLVLTKRLILAGELLQIKVLDHVIIGKNGYYSMAEKGDIERLKAEIRREIL